MITLAETDGVYHSNGQTPDTPLVSHNDWQKEYEKRYTWQSREPNFVHSLKWHSEDGIEHMCVVRSDSIDDLWLKVKTITTMIKASRAKQQQIAADDDLPKDGWCAKHQAPMKQQRNEQGKWFSHRHDGAWCHGKAQ